MIPFIFALVSAIGGSNAPVVKFTVSIFPTFIFVALRALIAISITLPLLVKSKNLKITEISPKLLIVNILFTANWLTFAFGVQKTTVVIAQLIYVPTSIVIAILGFVLFGERLSRNQIIGLTLTIFGSLILILGSSSGELQAYGTPLGNLLVAAGMFLWAAYTVFSGRLSKTYSPLTITFYNFMVSLVFALFLALMSTESRNFNFTTVQRSGFLALAYVGIFSSALYFYLNQWLIKHTSAFVASLQIYPITVVASVLGIVFFRDKLTLNLAVAASLIMMGVFMATSYDFLKNKINKVFL